jgi:hypothetical protein
MRTGTTPKTTIGTNLRMIGRLLKTTGSFQKTTQPLNPSPLRNRSAESPPLPELSSA